MKVKQVPYKDALEALKVADKSLQESKAGKDRRAAALAFAVAERTAKSAKKRETEGGDGSLLDGVK